MRLNDNNNKGNEYWEVASNYQYRTTEATEPKTEVNTKTETAESKPMRKKRKVLWNRVAIAGVLCAMLIYGGVVAISSLRGTFKTADSSSSAIAESSSIGSEDSSSPDSKPIKEVRIDLSEEDFATVVLATQHENGIDPMLFLTLDERARYDELQQQSTTSQDEQQELFMLEETAKKRKDEADYLTAASMLNRIGKHGFGVESESNFGAVSKDLTDVLSQNGQYKSENENLLSDIADYSKLVNADQFDPCDQATIANVNKLIYGDVDVPSNLFYEISWRLDPGDDPAEEAEKALKSMISDSPSIHLYSYVPCSYGGNDYIAVFGTNDLGTGYGEYYDFGG